MTALIAAILAPFAVVTAFFVVELFAGLARLRLDRQEPVQASAVVLVPAHDEEAVIGDTLRLLRTAIGERTRILVIADNCSDATAARAREAGVEVVERNERQYRGKGYALAAAAEHLKPAPPDVVVVIDADCAVDAPSLAALVNGAAASGRPAQAVNLLRPDRGRSALVQLSTFGFMLKNLVRQRGLQRVARRVHLTGTGMAMPFNLFAESRLASASIVEDLALGLELAERGHAPRLVPDATVWSSGSTEQGTLVQRRRWEGGFLAVSLRHAPRVIGRGLARGDLRAVLAGFDLLVPPLALFALLNGTALLTAFVLALLTGAAWWPIVVHLLLLAAAVLAVFAAWLREGRDFISLAVLLRLPFYVLWKLPLYLSLGRGGAPREWLRTGR